MGSVRIHSDSCRRLVVGGSPAVQAIPVAGTAPRAWKVRRQPRRRDTIGGMGSDGETQDLNRAVEWLLTPHRFIGWLLVPIWVLVAWQLVAAVVDRDPLWVLICGIATVVLPFSALWNLGAVKYPGIGR